MGVLQPIHFILSAIGRQCSSVLSRFKTVQIQTLRKRKIGITLISSPQRTAVCVSKSDYSVSAELVSWSIPVGRSRNTRWRPTPLNPFWKRGEINFIWPNFKLERSHWQQCPIHSWFDSAEKRWVIWPWKISSSQIALDCSVCVQMYTGWTQYKATLWPEWHMAPLFFFFTNLPIVSQI